EQCDDDNTTSGDGCQGNCTVQPGFDCTGSPSVCTSERPGGGCGNGVVESGEECDGGACCNKECELKAAGRTCRRSAGACDGAEKCSGTSATCPADVLAPSTTVCRAAVSAECDVAEKCTGASAVCPADAIVGCPDLDGIDCVHPACGESGECTTVDECVEICR